jgi:hypothetical protein
MLPLNHIIASTVIKFVQFRHEIKDIAHSPFHLFVLAISREIIGLMMVVSI